MNKPVIQQKYQPLGFEILHEDEELIVGNKAAGFLSVAALWDKTNTVHSALNTYVRKGSLHSKKCVYVVHRLDQVTSGILMYAKNESVQYYMKENWPTTIKTYYAIVHGKMPEKSGTITSHLVEDEDYVVRSTSDSKAGKLAQTHYTVVKEIPYFSVLKLNLLTGRKNQLRVHLAEAGHPIVGDVKYGDKISKHKNLMLHSFSIVFTQPKTNERIRVQADVPEYFHRVVNYRY